MDKFVDFLDEAPRIKRIKLRIRNGKVQRNIKKSGVKGYTFRQGHLVRMSATERIHRRRGARRAKVKRRAKLARILTKRRRSLRRLHSFTGKH